MAFISSLIPPPGEDIITRRSGRLPGLAVPPSLPALSVNLRPGLLGELLHLPRENATYPSLSSSTSPRSSILLKLHCHALQMTRKRFPDVGEATMPMICGRPVGSTVQARKMLNPLEPYRLLAPEALALPHAINTEGWWPRRGGRRCRPRLPVRHRGPPAGEGQGRGVDAPHPQHEEVHRAPPHALPREPLRGRPGPQDGRRRVFPQEQHEGQPGTPCRSLPRPSSASTAATSSIASASRGSNQLLSSSFISRSASSSAPPG